ncbi:MAG: adenylosuccinate synthase [Anaerolineaceae bacterium]|nr:adenylosuccinate synthase [Anaerolineaceae bacterium]
MPLQIIIGTQWGDEGKGRFVDLFSKNAAYVARFAGGDNAGHTVKIGEKLYKLHLIPSGLVYPNTVGVLGNGMVVNPVVFLREMEELRSMGVEITADRLLVSERAHMITPAHLLMDQLREFKRGSQKIGTTGRGIGPAYTDKVKRTGILFYDLRSPQVFASKLRANLEEANEEIADFPQFEALDVEAIVDEYLAIGEKILPHVQNTSRVLRKALGSGQMVIAEGAQGVLLDIDHGSYPYVTSSSCSAANALLSLGIGIPDDLQVIGVVKAFQTRVGEGGFPTEIFGDAAVRLRGDGSKQWDEFGTTTGRPRRVGWLDTVLLREAVQMNEITELAMTKLDVLSGLNEIKLGVAYEEKASDFILDNAHLTPVFEQFEGWHEDIQDVTRWKALPRNARRYVEAVEELVGAFIRWVSVGPERTQYIERD